jgi:hypothetical protein
VRAERFTGENGEQQITEGCSAVRGRSGDSCVSEVVGSVTA